MDNSKVKVEIFGQKYTINGDASPEYIVKLADYVNSKMEEISSNISNMNPTQVAILAALNLADEYHQLKNGKHSVDGELIKKTEMLISMLDEGLIGDIFSRV